MSRNLCNCPNCQTDNCPAALPPVRVNPLVRPWPPRDVVEQLCRATDALIYKHDYDRTGYEEISRALSEAKEWLMANKLHETEAAPGHR